MPRINAFNFLPTPCSFNLFHVGGSGSDLCTHNGLRESINNTLSSTTSHTDQHKVDKQHGRTLRPDLHELGQSQQSRSYEPLQTAMWNTVPSKKISDRQSQIDEILLRTGETGILKFNSWGLSEDEKINPDIIWAKFMEYGKWTQNFCLPILICLALNIFS